jgi:O-antigen ligase
VVYLFLIYSRIFDVKMSFLHIPGISYRIILAMVFLSRAFLTGLKSGIGRCMGFMTLWFILSIPTSLWRRGSLEILTDAWLPCFVIFLATAGLIGNFEQCRRSIYTVGWALFVLTLIAVFWGTAEETGRLFLPHGKFSNPNEMGQALLLGMPLWGMMLLDTKSLVKKAFAAGVMFLMLMMVSKTGSRGALIAFGALVLTVFLRASLMDKLKLIIVGCVVLGIVIELMPGKLIRRYTTYTGAEKEEVTTADPSDYDAELEASATSSTQSRRELLRKSIKFTLQHPLFGVGPGMFTVAEDTDAKANGKHKGTWQGTHNSYTQVSSEIGIPGALAYVAVIFLSIRKSAALYKRTRGDPRLARIGYCALGLNYCMIVYAVSVIFDYIAYTSMLSVFSGLTAALDATAGPEIDRLTAVPAGPPPTPFEAFRPAWRRTAGVPQQA